MSRKCLFWAVVASLGYLIVALGIAIQIDKLIPHLKSNEFGDLLADVFSPLAFVWFVVAVFMQRAELKMQRRELEMQRQELVETRSVLKEQREELRASSEQNAAQSRALERANQINLDLQNERRILKLKKSVISFIANKFYIEFQSDSEFFDAGHRRKIGFYFSERMINDIDYAAFELHNHFENIKKDIDNPEYGFYIVSDRSQFHIKVAGLRDLTSTYIEIYRNASNYIRVTEKETGFLEFVSYLEDCILWVERKYDSKK